MERKKKNRLLRILGILLSLSLVVGNFAWLKSAERLEPTNPIVAEAEELKVEIMEGTESLELEDTSQDAPDETGSAETDMSGAEEQQLDETEEPPEEEEQEQPPEMDPPEQEQPEQVKRYLMEFTPDILILTGHDGLLKGKKGFSCLENYRNSRSFVRAVRKAREFEPGRDDLIIFAGACQSHYESLIHAGANFASSPRRVLIHAYDPVFIAEKVAFTPFNQMVPITETLRDTITGTDGVGGIETRGRLRIGYPKSPY